PEFCTVMAQSVGTRLTERVPSNVLSITSGDSWSQSNPSFPYLRPMVAQREESIPWRLRVTTPQSSEGEQMNAAQRSPRESCGLLLVRSWPVHHKESLTVHCLKVMLQFCAPRLTQVCERIRPARLTLRLERRSPWFHDMHNSFRVSEPCIPLAISPD